MRKFFNLLAVMSISFSAIAENTVEVTEYQRCLLRNLDEVSEETAVGELKGLCQRETKVYPGQTVVAALPSEEKTRIQERLAREREGVFNPFALTPHKPNYIMFSVMDEANQDPYVGLSDDPEPIDDTEMLFQVSFKAPIWQDVLGSSGDLFFAYTAKSSWQLFNDEISSPFRETNYEPEVFWQQETDREYMGWQFPGYRLGFVHQSNGRNIPLSRSWNRIYAQLGFDRGPWSLILKPWYRIPEDEKKFPDDTDGDDNPDMWKYMGYGEYTLSYRTNKQHLWSLMTRYNFNSDSKGATELTWSFPLTDRFRVYSQIFSGYGDTMIDYDESITRFSVGLALTDNL